MVVYTYPLISQHLRTTLSISDRRTSQTKIKPMIGFFKHRKAVTRLVPRTPTNPSPIVPENFRDGRRERRYWTSAV
jgi:hypothetical protein